MLHLTFESLYQGDVQFPSAPTMQVDLKGVILSQRAKGKNNYPRNQ